MIGDASRDTEDVAQTLSFSFASAHKKHEITYKVFFSLSVHSVTLLRELLPASIANSNNHYIVKCVGRARELNISSARDRDEIFDLDAYVNFYKIQIISCKEGR